MRITTLVQLVALGPGQAWVAGVVVLLAVLRPVGRLGIAVAAAFAAAALLVLARLPDTVADAGALDGAWWSLLPWLLLAGLLVASAAAGPVRLEPRTGPGAAVALLVGAGIFHVAAAVAATSAPTEGLVGAVTAWGSGDLDAARLAAAGAGPLAAPLVWGVSTVPGVSTGAAAALVSLASVALIVWGCDRLGSRWGFIGTARCTAAAVAWMPPLLLAHGRATGALLATAALVWGWWALGEVWGGRHLPDRMALLSGGLLGLAVGAALWPAVVVPLWLRRLGGRRAGWFVVGTAVAVLATVLALVPGRVGLVDVWAVVRDRFADATVLPAWTGYALALLVVAIAVPGRALSPTRLAALTGAALIATLPWWPVAGPLAGPVSAVAFVVLAAVAPDRPGERWPPDAELADDRVTVEA